MSTINAVTEGEHQVFKLSKECVIPQTRSGRTCGGFSTLIISTGIHCTLQSGTYSTAPLSHTHPHIHTTCTSKYSYIHTGG